MLVSNALNLGTIFFALFAVFAMFYGMFLTQLKLNDTSEYNFLTKDDTAWFKPKTKVIMLVIDALRFDYLLDYENIDHDKKLQANKFKKFNEAFYQDPEKFVVLRSFSDSPTYTSMRAPCLMTGNVPQKAHIMTSFGTLALQEDNIPRQVKLQGGKSYFTGDPVLLDFFPEYLISSTDVRGFDVRNKKVDGVSQEFIKKKIADNDFDLLLAHLLLLDHMGHAYDLYHKALNEASQDVDQLIVDIMNSIDDDTILLFAGDHGMTASGDHGYDSPQETNTALVAFHKKGFMKYKLGENTVLNKVMRSVNETQDQVRQVDVVPTLAMLMGVPIPFSNLGQVVNDIYPVGDYYKGSELPEGCPSEVGFEMQMLHDNHLNTLQILNYFNKYQKKVHLFNKEYSSIVKLTQQIEAAYQTAQEMIDNSEQCQEAFHEVVANAILLSQQLATQVFQLFNTKSPFEMIIYAQGLALLILVAIAYILIVQYLHMTKDYEYLTLKKPESLKAAAKSYGPVIALVIIIWIGMLASGSKIMHPITTSLLVVGIFIFGSSASFFLQKNQELHQTENPPSSVEGAKDEERQPFPLKSLFILQSPLITAGAVGIFIYLFYLIHAFRIDREKVVRYHWMNPYIIFGFLALRICGRYPKIAKHILSCALGVGVGLCFLKVQTGWSEKLNTIMGLLLIADWVLKEIHFVKDKLKATTWKAWNYQYLVGFLILSIYHLIENRELDLIRIILPRIIWGLIIGSFFISLFFKMKSRVIKRNLQVYFVLFMALLQSPTKLVYFGMVLSGMRVASYLFNRASFKNYLYPLVVCLIGYIGLFFLNYTDRVLPNSFAAAFVGLRDFHIVFSLLFYSIAMMSTVILGVLFISFSDQDLELQEGEVELGVQKEEDEDSRVEVIAIKGQTSIIKKRNVMLSSFFYNTIMISASVNILVWRGHNLQDEGVMPKFMMDTVLYSTVILSSYLIML